MCAYYGSSIYTDCVVPVLVAGPMGGVGMEGLEGKTFFFEL